MPTGAEVNAEAGHAAHASTPALKSAAISLAVVPTLKACQDLLKDADLILNFAPNANLSAKDQAESIRETAATIGPTRALLEAKQKSLHRQYARWENLLESLSKKDSAAVIEAEHSAFQSMINDANGLANILEETDTAICKLTFLEQTCKTQLHRLGILDPSILTSSEPSQSASRAVSPAAVHQNLTQLTSAQTSGAPQNHPLPAAQTLSMGQFSAQNFDSIPAATQPSGAPHPLFNTAAPLHSLGRNDHIRLPQVELPTFNGSPCDWFSFWGLFQATVDSQPQLSPVEKLTYLLGCLRGKAKDAVVGYQITGDNYRAVLSTLKTLFGNKEDLGRRLQMELRRLRNPNHNSADLMRYHSEVTRILHQMRITGMDVENEHVLFELEEHLPDASKICLYKEKKRYPTWTTDAFQATLLDEAQMLAVVRTPASFSLDRVAESTTVDGRFRRGVTNSHFGSNESARRDGIQTPLSSAFTGIVQHRSATRNDSTAQRHWRNTASANPTEQRQGQPVRPAEQRLSGISFRSSASAAPQRKPCIFCKGSHWQSDCDKFATLEQRQNRIRELNVCFICFGSGHNARNCRKGPCYFCKKRHNQALCPERLGNRGTTTTRSAHTALTEASEVEENSATTATVMTNQGKDGVSLLLWLTAPTFNPVSPLTTTRARIFLDQGSQLSFITEHMAHRLGFGSSHENDIVIKGVGTGDSIHYHSAKVSVGLIFADGTKHLLIAHTLPKVTDGFLHASITANEFAAIWHQAQTELPLPLYTDAPDILIGSDFISKINPRVLKHLPSGFALYESELGPMIGGFGTIQQQYWPHADVQQATTVLVGSTRVEIADAWKLDSIGINLEEELLEDDARAQMSLDRSLTRLPNGRYSVSWPWRSEHPQLAVNFGLCLGRLQSLLRTLRANPDRLRRYADTIRQQLEVGVIERAPTVPSGPLVHYIPHQMVWNEEKQKLRVVYDASASAPRGQALNNNLFRGPVLLPDLVGVLLRLRRPRIAIIGDLEKAFLQVQLNETDRDVARFLWIEDPTAPLSALNNIVVYRFQRVFFGCISSPFLLAGVIRHHLSQSSSPWAPAIAANIYVDNVLLGASTIDEAKEAYKAAKEIFASAKMNLCDFSTNSSKLREQITTTDRHEGTTVKVLGLLWNTDADTLAIKTQSPMQGLVSKRSVLRFIAKHFDPLGFIAPALMPLKAFLQDMTKLGPMWDATASTELQHRWNELQARWQQEVVTVPRVILSEDVQLHIFSDASTRAYAAVVYVRNNIPGSSPVFLVMAKSRIGPIQSLSIPRLELLGILIGIRLGNFIAHQLRVTSAPKFLWSDSKCALAWIASGKEDKLPRFVQNRLREIRLTTGITYSYVRSEHNPADLATRGLTPTELVAEKRWWEGPAWLTAETSQWPAIEIPSTLPLEVLDDIDPLQSVPLTATTISSSPATNFQLIDHKRFSDWRRLIDATAWALRFLRKVWKRPPAWLSSVSERGPLMGTDRRLAERCIIRQIQDDAITPADVDRWELQKDSDEIWRCMGRLGESNLQQDVRHPVFLPRRSHCTELIILDIHRALFHGGTPTTLTKLRQRFWVSHGRKTVKTAINRCCMECHRWKAKPFALPPMPNLPTSRVRRARAFDSTAVDFFGPITVKSDLEPRKKWVALFTCMTTRAVHLELADDLSANGFVHCFRRFMARRGVPSTMLSDNGTNFRLTASSLSLIPEASQIKWSFVTALAPWSGGVYERMVGLTKHALKRAIGRRLLSDSELRTFATEAEAVVNQRPLTYVEAESLKVLRPIDFIQPGSSLLLNVDVDDEGDATFSPSPPSSREELIRQWQNTQLGLGRFWDMWHKEYLQLLREQQRRLHKGPHAESRRTPRIGEVVLMHDENAPRGMWKLAKILQLPATSDQKIRTALVRSANGHQLLRPISLLYPLEVAEETQLSVQEEPIVEESSTAEEHFRNDDEEDLPPRRVTRSTAKRQVTAAATEMKRAASLQEQQPCTNFGTFKAPFFVFIVLAVLATVAAEHVSVQVCPYQHTGFFARFPHSVNCTARAQSRWTTQRVSVYRRQLIAINATYCSKLTRTVCTWSFLRLSLQVTNDTHSVDSVPIEDCVQLRNEKRLGANRMQQAGSPHKWTTTNPVRYSYYFIGTHCQTTTNYVMEEGEAVLFDGTGLLADFTRTAGCRPRDNKCFTRHETIYWNYTDFESKCHYRYDGTYSAQVSGGEVFVSALQAAFIQSKENRTLGYGCNIDNPVFAENDVVLSFSTIDDQGTAAGQRHEQLRPLIAERVSNSFEPLNTRLQYLNDLEIRRNALKWCTTRNELVSLLRWISISDPTAAGRLLLGRSDISARYVGEYLLISKCYSTVATDVYWNHQIGDECFEWLPVSLEGKIAFVIPHTHDIVDKSRKLPCPWRAPPKEVAEMRVNSLTHFSDTDTRIVFNAAHPPDVSRQLIQLAIERLGRVNFRDPGQYSSNQTKSFLSSSGEVLQELGYEIGTTVEEIEEVLQNIVSYWRWISAGIFLVVIAVLIGLAWIYCPCIRCRQNLTRSTDITLHLDDLKPNGDSESTTAPQSTVVEDSPLGVHKEETENVATTRFTTTFVPFRVSRNSLPVATFARGSVRA